MTHQQLDRTRSSLNLGSDDTGCPILHVDMDSFFASVEIRDRPHLRGQPVIVGHSGGRGVVVSCTYEARARGIHSAMPMSIAHRTFPDAVYIEPSRGKYGAASKEVMAVLSEFTPEMEAISVDEAFLNVAGAARSIGSPVEVGKQIRIRMREHLRLPCSVGVAPVTMAAKIASTMAKPDGLMLIPKAQLVEFLHDLPVGRLWGVGDSTRKRLESIGVVTVGDLAAVPEARLARSIGKASASRLQLLAAGHELRPIQHGTREKSIGAEVTFERDHTDPAIIERELRGVAESTARRLRKASMMARQITLKLRFDDFSTISRSHTLAEPNDAGAAIFAAILPLWRKEAIAERPIRLVGIRAEQLSSSADTGRQLTFDEQQSSWSETDEVMDKVEAKFGSGAVMPARMLKSGHSDE